MAKWEKWPLVHAVMARGKHMKHRSGRIILGKLTLQNAEQLGNCRAPNTSIRMMKSHMVEQ